MPKSFQEWLREVDRQVYAQAGLSIHDLDDCPLADWHEQRVSPKGAARRAIRAAGGEA